MKMGTSKKERIPFVSNIFSIRSRNLRSLALDAIVMSQPSSCHSRRRSIDGEVSPEWLCRLPGPLQWQALQGLQGPIIKVLQYLEPGLHLRLLPGFPESFCTAIGIRGEQVDRGLGDSLQQQIASMQLFLCPTSLDQLPHTAHERVSWRTSASLYSSSLLPTPATITILPLSIMGTFIVRRT